MKVSHGENPISVIDSLFANTVKPDLVFLDVSSIEYTNRMFDLPKELVEYVAKNPRVKFMWDGRNPLKDDENYDVILSNLDNVKETLEKSYKP